MSNTETLTCAVGGHQFTRERVRGRKPRLCPKHKAEAVEAQESGKPAPEQTHEPSVARTGWGGPTDHELDVVYPRLPKFEREKVEALDRYLAMPTKQTAQYWTLPEGVMSADQHRENLAYRTEILRRFGKDKTAAVAA